MYGTMSGLISGAESTAFHRHFGERLRRRGDIRSGWSGTSLRWDKKRAGPV